MSNFIHIKTITELHEAYGVDKPKHPLITVIDFSEVAIPCEALQQKISMSFYNISLKTKFKKGFKYGREYFDFAEGALYGMAPNQVVQPEYEVKKGELAGWSLYFHPDLIRHTELIHKIQDYGFFSYQTCEALHVSDKEKAVLQDIIHKIEDEYQSNIDEFSQDVLVANIELLLNYIKRFYSRQFITRKVKNTDVLSRFKQSVQQYFSSEDATNKGLPKVSYFAQQLHLSDNYLSDLLKKETGQSTKEHIDYYLIERAKNILAQSELSISEVAYDLGFDYPQHFSKLFKRKTGMSPSEFRMN